VEVGEDGKAVERVKERLMFWRRGMKVQSAFMKAHSFSHL